MTENIVVLYGWKLESKKYFSVGGRVSCSVDSVKRKLYPIFAVASNKNALLFLDFTTKEEKDSRSFFDLLLVLAISPI